MTAKERREAIWAQLQERQKPISATTLAGMLGVSRQIIVGDVALLRAGGARIVSTARGYIIPDDSGSVRHIVCQHTAGQTQEELYAVVDGGCTVLDVTVEHPVYGQLSGQLQLSSRYDVAEFIRRVEKEQATPLSALTGGVHLHRLRCPDEAACRRVCQALDEAGFLVKE